MRQNRVRLGEKGYCAFQRNIAQSPSSRCMGALPENFVAFPSRPITDTFPEKAMS